MRACSDAEAGLDERELAAVRALVREQLNPWFLRSRYWNRAYVKPHGYAGDFRMLEWIYELEHSRLRGPDTAGGGQRPRSPVRGPAQRALRLAAPCVVRAAGERSPRALVAAGTRPRYRLRREPLPARRDRRPARGHLRRSGPGRAGLRGPMGARRRDGATAVRTGADAARPARARRGVRPRDLHGPVRLPPGRRRRRTGGADVRPARSGRHRRDLQLRAVRPLEDGDRLDLRLAPDLSRRGAAARALRTGHPRGARPSQAPGLVYASC